MKVDYASDLHVNHHVPFTHNQLKWEKRTKEWTKELLQTGQGEVLVLAGDFSEWNRQTLWVLEVANELYDQTFIVFGNHDYYLLTKKQMKKYGHSKARLLEVLAGTEELDNVTCLHGDKVTYNHVTFAGHGLWYTLETHKDEVFFQEHSNDSRFIKGESPFKPVTEEFFEEAMDWYADQDRESVDVMISHVPPLHPSISHHPYNACYVCPVAYLVGKHWIAGHQHVQGEFTKAGTHFYMNAIGYPDECQMPKLATFTID